jgi:tetratricopeptide (TPR) repeat protein
MKSEQAQLAQEKLQHILFISLPEGTERRIGSFVVDDRHLIPVELPPGSSEFDLSDLTWEMIISAMLKILAYQPEHEDIAYYRSFITAVQPNLVSELTKTGIIKAEAKEYELAEEIFLALCVLSPQLPVTLLNLAMLYEDIAASQAPDSSMYEKYTEKAFSRYREAVELHPDSPDVHYACARFYIKRRNPSKAAEHFELFLTLAPEDERSGEAAAALSELKKHSDDDELFSSAYDLITLGKEEEAVNVIERFLSRNDRVWSAWFIKGWALRRLGRYSEGAAALLRCLELEGKNADIYNELAICQMETGELSKAYASLRRALDLEPENTKIIANFGVVELKRNRPEEALRFFRTVLELDPDDPVAAEYARKISGTEA